MKYTSTSIAIRTNRVQIVDLVIKCRADMSCGNIEFASLSIDICAATLVDCRLPDSLITQHCHLNLHTNHTASIRNDVDKAVKRKGYICLVEWILLLEQSLNEI